MHLSQKCQQIGVCLKGTINGPNLLMMWYVGDDFTMWNSWRSKSHKVSLQSQVKFSSSPGPSPPCPPDLLLCTCVIIPHRSMIDLLLLWFICNKTDDKKTWRLRVLKIIGDQVSSICKEVYVIEVRSPIAARKVQSSPCHTSRFILWK